MKVRKMIVSKCECGNLMHAPRPMVECYACGAAKHVAAIYNK